MGSRGAWGDGDVLLETPVTGFADGGRRKKTVVELVLDDDEEPTAVDVRKEELPRSSAPTTPVVDDDSGYIHDLVRDFFRAHGMQAALDAFDLERPPPQQVPPPTLSDADLGFDASVGGAATRLEAFVLSWNQVEHGLTLTKKASFLRHCCLSQSKAKAPKKKLSLEPPEEAVPTLDLGVPGCTPKPRLADLQSFGFDDLDDVPAAPALTPAPTPALTLELPAKHSLKRVTIGEEGRTPKKEYFFYRETPPSFVTESEEAARAVKEQLSLDPAYDAPGPEVVRFVELASSDVSKYVVGKRVEGLGANRDVSGVVTEKHGSKLCGTSGPGTITIDTSLELEADH
ncbi:hypothetical protein ACHHYP_20355 [Achlya hypogyna]|uniref:Uncharacterized protein n=1 Tax=Achlya hypogyna TaxID=1202772 RepID=A0A1V9ZL30_ACHHY|nr:hypothetical protein ACHHYP_20355 [Achlya hypogyna]